jgi:hypothetical protein
MSTYRRLNITLPDDVVARADEFAKRERYTRSALIAVALDAFVARDPRLVQVAGAPGAYVPESVGLNPAVRPRDHRSVSQIRRDLCRARRIVDPAGSGDHAA